MKLSRLVSDLKQVCERQVSASCSDDEANSEDDYDSDEIGRKRGDKLLSATLATPAMLTQTARRAGQGLHQLGSAVSAHVRQINSPERQSELAALDLCDTAILFDDSPASGDAWRRMLGCMAQVLPMAVGHGINGVKVLFASGLPAVAIRGKHEVGTMLQGLRQQIAPIDITERLENVINSYIKHMAVAGNYDRATRPLNLLVVSAHKPEAAMRGLTLRVFASLRRLTAPPNQLRISLCVAACTSTAEEAAAFNDNFAPRCGLSDLAEYHVLHSSALSASVIRQLLVRCPPTTDS